MMEDFFFWTLNIRAKIYLQQFRTFVLLTLLTYHAITCCYITDPVCALCGEGGEHQTHQAAPNTPFLQPSAAKDVATIMWPGYPTSCTWRHLLSSEKSPALIRFSWIDCNVQRIVTIIKINPNFNPQTCLFIPGFSRLEWMSHHVEESVF
jgi:hypothetical protein